MFHSTDAFGTTIFNPTTTTIYTRERLYQVEKPTLPDIFSDRFKYMYDNNTFPVEAI